MNIEVTVVTGKKYNYNVPTEDVFLNFQRTLKSTRERGEHFLQLEKRYLRVEVKNKLVPATIDAWLNVNHIVSIEVDKFVEFDGKLDGPDESHLLAAKSFDTMTPEEKRAETEAKQPLIKAFEAAKAKDEEARIRQGLASKREGVK